MTGWAKILEGLADPKREEGLYPILGFNLVSGFKPCLLDSGEPEINEQVVACN